MSNQRFEDSPELFGNGVGSSTLGEFKCERCGILYNEGADDTEDYTSSCAIGHTTFAGLEIGNCRGALCFAAIETSVISRMSDILEWYPSALRQASSINSSTRAIDSVGLFGSDKGAGSYGEETCAICHTVYNEGADDTEDYNGDCVRRTYFGGMSICECCFAAVEFEIFNRMKDILPWYSRLCSDELDKIRTKKRYIEKNLARVDLCLAFVK